MSYYKGYMSQRGHGLGNVLGGILRSAIPIVGRTLKGVAKSAGRSILRSGLRSLKEERPISPTHLMFSKTITKPKRQRRKRQSRRRVQKGSGRQRSLRRRSRRKARKTSVKSTLSRRPRRGYKRKRSKSVSFSLPRKRRRVQRKRRRQSTDIFS